MKKYYDKYTTTRSTIIEQRRAEQKTKLEQIISQVKTDGGMFSYSEVAKKLGVSKERVRQMVDLYGLEDFKAIRREKALEKLAVIQNDPRFPEFVSVTQVAKYLNLDVPTVKDFFKENKIELKPLRERKKIFSKFMQQVEKAEANGFVFASHSVKEITDYFHANGMLLDKMASQIRLSMIHHKMEFRRVYSRGGK